VQPDDAVQDDLESASLRRVAALLLSLTAIFLTTTLVLAVFLLRERQELAVARGEVAAFRDAREQLLLEQPSDRAPYPHTVPSLSFVLNPALESATFKSGADLPYPVNRLGLRGPAITRKAGGTTRVVLVGDSLFFGWKLSEEDKLAAVLSQLIARKVPEASGRTEILTVALPGWNTRDQEAFLRSHLGRLAPDYIVWSLIRNDLFDTPGVVPPGLLASWNSPQARLPVPFQLRSPERHLDLPLPSLLARWRDSLLRIDRFAGEHGIPTTLLWWREKQRAVFDDLQAATAYAGPVLHIPGQYRYDEGNWCVEAPDCHPTRWANERIAVALAQHLVQAGALPPIDWSAGERAIIDAFAAAQAQRTNREARDRFYTAAARAVPAQFSPDKNSEVAVLYGMNADLMERNGAFVLRQRGAGGHTLRLDVQAIPPARNREQRITVTVRTADGDDVILEAALGDTAPQRLTLELPGAAPFGLHEIQWRFEYAECRGPTHCPAARFLGAELIETPRR